MTLSLAASPNGARIGFAMGAVAGQQVVLTIAPKAWRPAGPRHLWLSPDHVDKHIDLTLYETDRLHIQEPDSALGVAASRMLSMARDGDDDGALSWDSSLLAPDIPRRIASPNYGRPLDDGVISASATVDLLGLLERVRLIEPKSDDLKAGSTRSPLHRPLLYRRFLDEVLERVSSTRRGYRERSAVLGTIRGRVTSRSLAEHAATGSPRLHCLFDELTESTLLLRIVCAGLEWIADGRGVKSPFPNRYSERHLRHDAVTLRRSLGEVQALSPREARVVGARLRLNRLDQVWADALRMSLEVLAESELVASAFGPQLASAVELSVRTDELWERIVTRALGRSGLYPVHAQGRQRPGLNEDPWIETPKRVALSRPDNVAWHTRLVWIVDAKYKISGAVIAPSREDQYQMFAYSHLVKDDPNEVRSAVLVYPGEGPTRTWTRGRDRADKPVELTAISLPFPRPDQLRDPGTWESYLETSGRHIGEQLNLSRFETLVENRSA